MSPQGRVPKVSTGGIALIGVLGSALLTWASWAPEQATGARLPALLTSARPPLTAAAWAYAAGGLLLCLAWLLARPRDGRCGPRTQLGLALLWATPMLLALPMLSKDVWLYLDQGWQLTQGVDPYSVGLTEAGGPWASMVSPFWAGTTAVYPPLALRTGELAVVLGQAHPYWSVVALRLPLLLGLALVGVLVPRLARWAGADPAWASWLATSSPAVLLAGIGGAHHDMTAAVLSVAALWLAARGSRWSSLAVLALAVAVKQPAAVMGIPLVLVMLGEVGGRGHRDRPALTWSLLLARLVAAGAVTVLLFVAVSLVSGLGFGWTRALDVPRAGSTLAPGALVWQLVRPWVGGPADYPAPAASVVQLAGVGLIGWLLVRYRHGGAMRLAWLAPLVLALTSPALWPWYLLPTVMLLGTDRLGVRGRAGGVGLVLALTVVQLTKERAGYGVGLGLWPALALGAAVLLVCVLAARRHTVEG